MKRQAQQSTSTKRSFGQRVAAAVAAFRDAPAPAAPVPSRPLFGLLGSGSSGRPQDQLQELLSNPLVQRAIQMAGLADLATPNDPKGEGGALVGAAAAAESLVPILALRKTAEDLRDTKPLWPIVLPLAAWVGYRTYTKERARLLRQREQAKKDELSAA